MKLFVLVTRSESSDTYTYLIKHKTKPTYKEVQYWLSANAIDKDEDTIYETPVSLREVNEETALPIPKARDRKLLEFL